MKTTSPTLFNLQYRKPFLSILVMLFCISYVSSGAYAEACLPFYAQGENTAWPKYASVRVNISPSFSSNQRAAIRETFNN